MKTALPQRDHPLDSMIMAGVPIAIVYWVLDSILNIFFYNKYNILAELFGPHVYEVYTRIVVLCLLLIFGAHAQVKINELKQTRDALRKKEKDHRAFIENLTAGVYRSPVEGDGRFLRANSAMADLFGYRSVEELSQASVGDLIADPQDHEKFLFDISKSGSVRGREIQLKKRNGDRFWGSCSAAKKVDDNGIVRWIDGIVEDITARKRTENALRASEGKYRQLINYAPAGIYEVDLRTGDFVRVNDVMSEMTGFTREELLSMKSYELLTDDGKKQFFENLIRLHGGRNVPDSGEFKIRSKSGKELWVAINFRYHYEFEKVKSATAVAHDISRRRRAETEKSLLQNRLHRAQKMEAVGTLAGGIAHDFNNLLMSMQGNVSLMMTTTDYKNPHFHQLMALENHINAASALTSKLLGFAKGSAKDREMTNINELAQEQVRIFGRTRKDIRINERYQKDIWAVEVDPVQIKQVLLNIMVNALQAMPGGGDLHISTCNRVLGPNPSRRLQIPPGRYLALSITDTGIGMNKDTLRRAFEPFFTTQKMGAQKGIGLGLASAYGILKSHGGMITARSRPGRGSTFTMFLPATERTFGSAAAPSAAFSQPRDAVLAVNSDVEILEILEMMLERLGYATLKVSDGRRAWEIFQGSVENIEVVIFDEALPAVYLEPFLVTLDQSERNVKILISVDRTTENPPTGSLPNGIDGILNKPFSMVQLSRQLGANLKP